MKRQLVGAALFGFGLLCVLVAAALVWVVVPMERKVPFDLKPPDVVVVAQNATFVQAKSRADGSASLTVEHGGLQSRTGVLPDYKAAADLTGKLADNTLIWNVYQATDRVGTKEPINRAETRIALDRVSGAAANWPGQCYNESKADPKKNVGCNPGNIQFTGQLYLFPFGTRKQTYQYWDGSLRKALPIEYQGEEKYNGVPSYRFRQVVPQQNLDTDGDTLKALLGFLAPGATTGTMSYAATRTLWVEPQTGAIVGYQEQQHRELVPDTGARVVLLDAGFQYDDATRKAVKDQAVQGRTLILLLGRFVPIGLLVVGLLAMVLGVLLARRVTPDGEPDEDDVSEAEPTAVPQG
jgi:hypothetical protein